MRAPEQGTLSSSGPVAARRLAGRSPTVLVPLDGSAGAARALPVARAIAELEGASVHLVHVTDRARPAREVVGTLGVGAQDLFGTVLDEAVGPSPEALLRLAAQARLPRIVFGTQRGEVGPSPALWRLIAEADCPVVVVGGQCSTTSWSLNRVLLPHDGSPLTSTALGPPVRLAVLAGAALLVLHVATLFGPRGPGALPVPTYVDQPQHEWPEWSREFLGRIDVLWDLPAGLRPQLLVSRGEPGEEVVRFAGRRQIDLIGLGFHGSGEGERAATLKHIVAWAPCPVLVQRVDEAGFWSRCYPAPLAGPAGGLI